MIITLTHSFFVVRDWSSSYTLKALITDTKQVVDSSALLVLQLGTLDAAVAYPPYFSSKTTGFWRAFLPVAFEADQPHAVLHQQDGQNLAD